MTFIIDIAPETRDLFVIGEKQVATLDTFLFMLFFQKKHLELSGMQKINRHKSNDN